MRNVWLVAKHEYRRMVMRRGFVLGTIAIPLGLILVFGLAIVVAISQQNTLPIGYVDMADVLEIARQADLPDPEDRVQIRAYPDQAAAVAALEGEQIQAFFVLPPGYPEELQVDLYYLDSPPDNDAWQDFDDFVRANLLAAQPPDVQARLLAGSEIAVEDVASGRIFSSSSVVNIILPFVASIFFIIATMSAAGYLLRVVADEKENRTMEIMLTSVTPNQLIAGKALGLLAAALSQLLIYIVFAVVLLRVATPYVAALQQFELPWTYIGIAAIFFFPAYALVASVMVAIGGAVTEFQQGQQIAGLLNLTFMIPLFLTGILFENPGHPAMVALTLFPTTSFLTILLRWGLGTVPLWQLITSWSLLIASAAAMIWVAARVFHAGMLRYGQPLSLRGVLAALRN
jgi:ABC-2 type transport system permease protein